MFRNYLKIAYRNIRKSKFFSIIVILGLSIGMASCLLIIHYITFQRSFDSQHHSADRIYRIRYERTSEDGSAACFASCCPPAGAMIRERYPEAEKLARIFKIRRAVVSYEDLKFTEEKMFHADPEFFDIFNFSFISGNPLTGLKEPNRAFISRTAARKYFGNQDPIGRVFSVDKSTDYEVVGVFEDVPANSHIKFDFVLSFQNLVDQYGPDYMEAWGHTGMYTYIRLQSGADAHAFEEKLKGLVDAECGDWLRQYNMIIELKLQPLKDIHLTSHFMQEFEVNGSRDTVNFLTIIAFFIIIIAWFNYINLSTAKSLTRAREIGLRKVIGATRRQIIIQIYFEIFLLNLLAVLLTLAFILIVLPSFNLITGVPADYVIWKQAGFWMTLSGLVFLGSLLSGLYPVLSFSAYAPVSSLRGKFSARSRGISLRKVLVVTQFVLALVLITGTLTVFEQIHYMQHKDLGFTIDQILVVKAPRVRDDSFGDKIITFKDDLLGHSDISKLCVVTEVPGRQILWDAGGIIKAGEDISKSKNYQIVGIDYDFANVFEVQLAAGRSFSREQVSDQEALILNETAVRWLGFDDPQSAVGQQVNYWGELFTVIGVYKDYHQQSPKKAFEPHIYRLMPQGRGSLTLFAITINPSDIKTTIQYIEQRYADLFPGNPFDYFFLDDYFNQQYQADELLGKVFGIFASLAIFITSIGILGLAVFMVTQKRKEIGIRKVLGSNVRQILALLTREFVYLIILAYLLAVPLLYLGINQWLASFAVRMNLSLGIFTAPLLIVLIVNLVTIGSYVYKAAMANPVESLRYE